FWALALYRLEDYRRSGLPMLPVTDQCAEGSKQHHPRLGQRQVRTQPLTQGCDMFQYAGFAPSHAASLLDAPGSMPEAESLAAG
ncbi:MAG: hypothetical protein EBX60_06935, partial [Betaproteobacteria bacterium]|nr:hypothetical protein [Betaproteobacteria bacterium]